MNTTQSAGSIVHQVEYIDQAYFNRVVHKLTVYRHRNSGKILCVDSDRNHSLAGNRRSLLVALSNTFLIVISNSLCGIELP